MKLSGVYKSVKKNGAAAVPSAPVKSALQIGVCSGDDNSIKPDDVASTHSVPVNSIVQTGNSSGEIDSVEPTDGRVASSGPIKPAVKTGDSSDVRIGASGKASVSAVDKGKAVVTENDLGKGVPSESLLLVKAEIAATRRVDLHVQTHDDPVLKVCLWDMAAFDFCEKFNASQSTARVVLVTTLNPKRFGVLTLSAMASSRVFLDDDVQETRAYLSWLNSNLDVANRVNDEEITKPETATFGDLFYYMKQASSKVSCYLFSIHLMPWSIFLNSICIFSKVTWFECEAIIDDVVHGAAWYYVGCAVCHTKSTRGPTTLMCSKCGKAEIVGVAQIVFYS
ncbi:Uncharacterized protein Rs2_22010 [Raphanus sativus]|nr:Uncharacterized protein Rs2_22010 [Raphanus sativus]